jgi:hypothetical protein
MPRAAVDLRRKLENYRAMLGKSPNIQIPRKVNETFLCGPEAFISYNWSFSGGPTFATFAIALLNFASLARLARFSR